MRSLSSNLLKWRTTSINQEETRLIDTNELVARRIEALVQKKRQPDMDGFVSGLAAETVELKDFAGNEAESPGSVVKSAEAADEIRMQAKGEAEAIVAQAVQEAEELKVQLQEQLAREREQMLEQAREQGYQEGLSKAGQEYARRQKELDTKQKQLENAYEQQLEQLEPQFVDTITGIYEHIFHVELKSYREIVTYLISAAMRKIESNRDFIIHVSKEDYPYISMQKKQLTAGLLSSGGSIEIVEDLTLSKSDCYIETECGIFDCSLETQLSELRQKLKLLSYQKD